MANHRAANAVRVLGNAASAAIPGFLFGGPVGAGVSALVAGTIGGAQNVIEHRARKKAEAVANKKSGVTPGSKDKKKGSSFWNGEQARTEQLPLHNPQQQAIMNQLLPQTAQRLQSNEFDFEPIAEKSRRIQESRTEPSLAARFGSYEGGPSTSAFRNALQSSRNEHELGLDALRSEYGLKQQTQQQNLLNTLLQPTHQNLYFPQQPGFPQRLAENLIPQVAGQLASSGVQALGNAGASYFANKQQPVPANPTQAAAAAPQTIGQASTPQGQAAQAVAQAAQPVAQLGGAGTGAARQAGWTTAGRVGAGTIAGVGTSLLTNYFVNKFRGGE